MRRLASGAHSKEEHMEGFGAIKELRQPWVVVTLHVLQELGHDAGEDAKGLLSGS